MKNRNKNITIREAAEFFGISQVTIQRWIHQGKIPFRLMGNDYFFKYSELKEWADNHDLLIHETNKMIPPDQGKLSAAISAGGIHRNISGNDIWSVFDHAINSLNFIKESDRKKIHDQLLNREELASTGIGHGIALPHSRKRMNLDLNSAHISLFFLENSIDYNAIDGQNVDILFMMFTPDTQSHLSMLSIISQLLNNEDFLPILRKSNISNSELLKVIEETELNL